LIDANGNIVESTPDFIEGQPIQIGGSLWDAELFGGGNVFAVRFVDPPPNAE
jgi:hypothetical protein